MMKNKSIKYLAAAAAAFIMLNGSSLAEAQTGHTEVQTECTVPQAENVSSGTENVSYETENDKVASRSEMVEAVDVTEEWMTPVTTDELNEGEYEIDVRSSSSMFEITQCTLTVKDGAMSAAMSMSGTGYMYVYMGTPEEAASADEKDCIPFTETEDGTNVFTVPVEALDEALDCAAYSRRRQKWYGRQLCFVAESLREDAFVKGRGTSAEDLGLEDGNYTAEVSLEGGSGKASVTSPSKIEVKDSEIVARIEWSSSKYDYMIVDDEKYLPVNTGGNSVFEIPVRAFDCPVTVLADTTAMSRPYEIEYTITFDSGTLEKDDNSGGAQP